MIGHQSLENYYRTVFNLIHFHKYSMSDFDNLIPWERDILIDLLADRLEQEDLARKQQQSQPL